jgi:aryl-alcohol dehydrogenase-like predicted oxidoreductase
VATKGGHIRPGGAWELDGRPEHLRAACEASLRALDTDRIDLYQLHRPDPEVPYAESVGALADLQTEGKVRWVGLSNADTDQIEEARGIVDVVSVQNQLSLGYAGR